MKSGVYKITNSVTGKIYIGSAINIKFRWQRHLSYLRRGTHENEYLQRAFKKQGEAAFIFDVLEYCKESECIEREQFYIDKYTPTLVEIGYNMCPIAGSARGRVMSPEARAKISKGNMGKPKSAEARHAMSAAKTGKKTYPMSEEQKHKIRLTRIGKKASDETKQKLSIAHTGKKQSAEMIAKRIPKLSRKVGQYDTNGNFIREYSSIKSAGEAIGCTGASISQQLAGGSRTTMGFIFKYL